MSEITLNISFSQQPFNVESGGICGVVMATWRLSPALDSCFPSLRHGYRNVYYKAMFFFIENTHNRHPFQVSCRVSIVGILMSYEGSNDFNFCFVIFCHCSAVCNVTQIARFTWPTSRLGNSVTGFMISDESGNRFFPTAVTDYWQPVLE